MMHPRYRRLRESIAQLGDIAWADRRSHRVRPPGEEPDTQWEVGAARALGAHVAYNDHLPSSVTDVLRRALEDGAYRDMIRRVARPTVYRGLILPRGVLTRLIGGAPKGDEGSSGDPAPYTPLRGGESWTTDATTAADFATWGGPAGAAARRAMGEAQRYMVVVAADADDAPFLAGTPGLFDALKGTDKYRSESEVLNLGSDPVPLKGAWWVRVGSPSTADPVDRLTYLIDDLGRPRSDESLLRAAIHRMLVG